MLRDEEILFGSSRGSPLLVLDWKLELDSKALIFSLTKK